MITSPVFDAKSTYGFIFVKLKYYHAGLQSHLWFHLASNAYRVLTSRWIKNTCVLVKNTFV